MPWKYTGTTPEGDEMMGKQWRIVLDLDPLVTKPEAENMLSELLGLRTRLKVEGCSVRSVRPGKMLVEDIVAWAQDHQARHPGHGVNCVCADAMISQIRRETEVEGALAVVTFPHPLWKTQQRVDWVITSAVTGRR